MLSYKIIRLEKCIALFPLLERLFAVILTVPEVILKLLLLTQTKTVPPCKEERAQRREFRTL